MDGVVAGSSIESNELPPHQSVPGGGGDSPHLHIPFHPLIIFNILCLLSPGWCRMLFSHVVTNNKPSAVMTIGCRLVK